MEVYFPMKSLPVCKESGEECLVFSSDDELNPDWGNIEAGSYLGEGFSMSFVDNFKIRNKFIIFLIILTFTEYNADHS